MKQQILLAKTQAESQKTNNFKGEITMKKQSKLFKILVSTALVLLMTISLAVPAFAAGSTVTGTEQDPVKVAITKIFNMPVGTKTPDVTFQFDVTPIKVDGIPNNDVNMPGNIGPIDIEFKEADNGKQIGTGTSAYKSIIRESEDIFANVTWPHAGEFVYTITEKQDLAKDEFNEKLTCSQAVYEIHVYVKETADGKGYYIAAVNDYYIKNDNGGTVEGGYKVDPTPKDPDETGEYSEMIFTNKYLKNNGKVDPPDPDDCTVFKLSKDVAGDLADKSMYFNFLITLTKPATVEDDIIFIAYIMDEDGFVADITGNIVHAYNINLGTDNNGKKFIKFKSGDDAKIALKHGQWLAFTDAPVGTNLVVLEEANGNYVPKCTLVLNGNSSTLNAGKNESLGFGEDPNFTYLGEKTNIAAYVNTYDLTAPTGISIENLPFVVMIGLAIAGLAGFVVFKAHKNRAYDA